MHAPKYVLAGLALLVVACPDPPKASAKQIFVRTSGKDSNSGRSASQAVRTIQRALDLVRDGDTIYIGAGTYREHLYKNFGSNGGRDIKIIGDTRGKKTGDRGPVILAPPLDNRWTFVIYYARDLTIEHIEFRGPANAAYPTYRRYGLYIYAPFKDRRITLRHVTGKNLNRVIQLYGNADTKQQDGREMQF